MYQKMNQGEIYQRSMSLKNITLQVKKMRSINLDGILIELMKKPTLSLFSTKIDKES